MKQSIASSIKRPLNRRCICPSGSPPAAQYAIWVDAGAGLTISPDGLTVTQPDLSWRSVRADIAKTAGKWSFTTEITTGLYIIAGLGTASAPLNTFLGADGNGYGYFNANGQIMHNGSGSAFGASFTSPGTLLVEYDAATCEVQYTLNGALQGVVTFTDLIGQPVIPMASLYDGGGATVMVANFGQTEIAGVSPGYNNGVYNE